VLPTDTPIRPDNVNDQRAQATVNDTANLRSGPSTDYERLGSAALGTVVEIIGRNSEGDWYQLATGAWIAAFLVDGAPGGLPVVGDTSGTAPTAPAAAVQTASNIPAGAVAARLVRVVDGDTIEVTVSGRQERVRYIGIDTPERGQPGSGTATDANGQLLGFGDLFLVADTSDRDQYGRLLRYVYTPDGALVNRELVAQGWAQPVEYPPDTRYAADLRAAAVEAANAGLGFWGGIGSDGAMPFALAAGNVNIRQGPGADFEISATVANNTPLTVFGRTTDGQWLQVRAPDRSGGWVAASVVVLAVAAGQIALASDVPAAPAGAVDATRGGAAALGDAVALTDIALVIIENHNTFELLEIYNRGQQAVDIGGWALYGSKGDERCVIPGGAVLQPGEGFQVATGDSQPRARGMKCGDKPIWNNDGETIYLEAPDGRRIEIQSRRV
jgi:micrococcal nuclease